MINSTLFVVSVLVVQVGKFKIFVRTSKSVFLTSGLELYYLETLMSDRAYSILSQSLDLLRFFHWLCCVSYKIYYVFTAWNRISFKLFFLRNSPHLWSHTWNFANYNFCRVFALFDLSSSLNFHRSFANMENYYYFINILFRNLVSWDYCRRWSFDDR